MDIFKQECIKRIYDFDLLKNIFQNLSFTQKNKNFYQF